MLQSIKTIFIILCLSLFSSLTSADPWFTGPLLAPAGHTIPKGHSNFEVYGIDVFTDGAYNAAGNVIRTPLFRSFIINPILTHGFTDWLDFQITVPYVFNSTRGVSSNRLTDVSVAAGFQLFEQKGALNRMDVRVLLQETLPTGRYDHLNPQLAGTDATGLGAYQTQLGINLQYLLPVFNTHYLRTRLIISRIFGSTVWVDGLSSYGGTNNTHGRIRLGAENDYDLAFEYTLTQHWVAVMEGYISNGQNTRFNGILDIGNVGSPPTNISIGNGAFKEKALAPALEYNFNSKVGIIGGVWFPVSGKNTSHYLTYMLALNAFW
ncbi:hypothetical protein [Legionella quateirensis]|uniref:Fe-S protein n=1 Tax=Legionella quateirensis TaxID=45072 RepID=A0A378L268_9GAMM|nr:hypothetical protein [Legionella quateirensis]KTD43328.1 Fe-S protein [Legionella quateirensis]STY18210.1 Fe-S protein [Legionella quateirensis]